MQYYNCHCATCAHNINNKCHVMGSVYPENVACHQYKASPVYDVYYWLPKQSRLASSPFRFSTHNISDMKDVLKKCNRYGYDVEALFILSPDGVKELKANTIAQLFKIMSHDMETMSYYGDDESALLAELFTADDEIINSYCDVFEVTV